MSNRMTDLNIAFFGTPQFATLVFDELLNADIMPSVVVTQPNKPKGRKQVLTPPPVKVWAEEHNIEVLQPKGLKEGSEVDLLFNSEWDLFIVAAYGLLFPKKLVEKPRHGTLVWHPSLLPKYRGPSPMRSQILNDDRECGITIMLMDEKMDHGPIVAQATVELENWPVGALMLENLLATEGGRLLAEVIPEWIAGKITPEPQDEAQATFCKKITKEDGLIDLHDDPSLDEAQRRRRAYTNFLKIQALQGWPGTYFFVEKNGRQIRVKIIEAHLIGGQLVISRVIPEGKKEMDYQDFMRNVA